MKKKFTIFIITFILFFIGINNVQADEPAGGGTNIGGGSTSTYAPCGSGARFCFTANVLRDASGSVIFNTNLQAIRVSVVDINGNRISGTKSIDVFRYADIDKDIVDSLESRQNLNFYNTKYTKNELVASKDSIAATSGSFSQYSKGTILKLSSGMFPKFNVNGMTSNPLRSYFENLLYADAAKYYFASTGYNYTSYTEEERKNHFLLVEPLIYYQITSNRPGTYNGKTLKWTMEYIGTVSEVANIMRNQTENPAWGNYYNMFLPGQTYDNWNFIGQTHFDLQFPLSVYVSENNPRDKSTVTAGLVNVSSWIGTVQDFSAEILTINGVAAGHVWIDRMQKPKCVPFQYTEADLPECCPAPGDADQRFVNHPLCTDEIITPLECDIDIEVSCPENCDASTSGYVRDSNNWPCIFQTITADNSNIKDHFFQFSNNYCSVFCREEINWNFPSGSFSVLAGMHFTVGSSDNRYSSGTIKSWGPILVEGFTECRTTSNHPQQHIKYNQFLSDWIEANKAVQEAWDALQEATLYDEAISKATCRSCECCVSCGTPEDPETCCSSSQCCSGKSNTYPYYGSKTASWGPCSGRPDAQVYYYQMIYNNAVSYRQSLIDQLKDCNNFQYDYNTFDPQIDLIFDEPMYGNRFELDGNIQENKYTDFYVGANKTRNSYHRTAITNIYMCGPSVQTYQRCKIGTITYPTNQRIEQFTIKTANYTLKKNVNRYISKETGLSQDTRPFGQYIDLGYSNLPIHYSTPTGKYDISLQYSTFGEDNKFNKYIFSGHVDMLYNYKANDILTKIRNDNMLNFSYFRNNGQASGTRSYISNCLGSRNQRLFNGLHDLSSTFVSYLDRNNLRSAFLNSECAIKNGCKSIINSCRINDRYWSWGRLRWIDNYSYYSANTILCANNEAVFSCLNKTTKIDMNIRKGCSTEYMCYYDVINDILDYEEDPNIPGGGSGGGPPGGGTTAKPTGLDVVFRPIDLANPFPGIAGKGRTPGANWDYRAVNDVILNNRGVKDKNIYFDVKPMYEITLTPQLIKAIRQHNRNVNKGYADFDLNCVTGTGRQCISKFLTDLSKNYSNAFKIDRCARTGTSWNYGCHNY